MNIIGINLDLKILPDELNKHYEVECIFRKSNKQENNKFELNKIKLGSNIFEFLFFLFKSFYQKHEIFNCYNHSLYFFRILTNEDFLEKKYLCLSYE